MSCVRAVVLGAPQGALQEGAGRQAETGADPRPARPPLSDGQRKPLCLSLAQQPLSWGGDSRGSGSATSYMVTATQAGLLGALCLPPHLQRGDKRNHSLPGQSEPRGRVHRSTRRQVGAAGCPRDGRLKLGERKRVLLKSGRCWSSKFHEAKSSGGTRGASLQEPPCAP